MAVAALGLMLSTPANAVMTSFTPSSKTVSVGSAFYIDLLATTGERESILGWDLNLAFDSSQVKFLGWEPGLEWDADSPPSVDPSGLAALSFPEPISGDNIVLATLKFRCLDEGFSTIGIAASADSFLAAQQGILLWTEANGGQGYLVNVGSFTAGTALVTQIPSGVPAGDPSTLLLLAPTLLRGFNRAVRRGLA